MLLRLEMPYVDRMVEDGIVERWHKQEGDPVRHGDDLLDLKIDRIRRQKRDIDPQRLSRWRFRRSSSEEPEAVSFRELVYFLRVRAVDQGVLRRISAREGTRLEIGEPMALLTTASDESLEDADPSTTSVFRVVTEVLEAS